MHDRPIDMPLVDVHEFPMAIVSCPEAVHPNPIAMPRRPDAMFRMPMAVEHIPIVDATSVPENTPVDELKANPETFESIPIAHDVYALEKHVLPMATL